MNFKKIYENQMINTYSGILFNYSNFQSDNQEEITYDFNCVEYKELIEKYQLDKIAGKGSEYNRARRLLHYLTPRLAHSSWYDNHIECNALKLLEYSLNNPERGINCLNKSKILEECCLALGIYARRVAIMPYSPYDFDNHVVVEIYDRKMKKWIMMDPTMDGIFVDENKVPQSLLEMREKFSKNEFITYVPCMSKLKNLKKLQDKYSEANAYISKNLFRFVIDKECRFGLPEKRLSFTPVNYSIKDYMINNFKFRINNLPKENDNFLDEYYRKLANAREMMEVMSTDILSMEKEPK